MATRANFYIDQGTDFLVSLEIESDQGDPYDINMQSFFCQARKIYSSSNLFDIEIDSFPQEDLNIVELKISKEKTQNVEPGKYQYDLIMQNSNGKRIKILEGLMFILPTVTSISEEE